MNVNANVSDARGLTFECQPECGFCCTGTAASVHTASWVLRTHLGEGPGASIAASTGVA